MRHYTDEDKDDATETCCCLGALIALIAACLALLFAVPMAVRSFLDWWAQ